MNPLDAEVEFRRLIDAERMKLDVLTPLEAVELMLRFYRSIRADGCDIEKDGDMLLFQWGIHLFGELQFQFDITRQLIPIQSEDQEIWQLHLTHMFQPTPAFESFGVGHRWCYTPRDVDEFAAFVRSHPVTRNVEARKDGRVYLRYDPV